MLNTCYTHQFPEKQIVKNVTRFAILWHQVMHVAGLFLLHRVLKEHTDRFRDRPPAVMWTEYVPDCTPDKDLLRYQQGMYLTGQGFTTFFTMALWL